MKRFFCTISAFRAGIGAALLLPVLWTGCSRPETEYDFSPAAAQIGTWIDSGYYAGGGLVVGDRTGILYSACFGEYAPSDPVYVASAGKWVAAATVAALVDQGRLSWESRAGEYVEGLKGTMADATLRQLLSHTAGYPAYQPEGRLTDRFNTLAESVEYLLPLEAHYPPGEHFEYGGLAMQVAGRMAELAAGKDWEAIFQENIAAPLGMTSSGFTPVDTLPGHSPMLGGGFHTTLDDYTRFLQMFYNRGMFDGRQVLSREAVAEIERDQVGRAEVADNELPLVLHKIPRSDIYGLGVWRELADADGAPLLLSSPGWAGAYPWIDREYDLYGFFIAHVDPPRASRDGFSAFYTAPSLAMTVRGIVPPPTVEFSEAAR